MTSLPCVKLKAEELVQLVKRMNDLGGKVSLEISCSISCACAMSQFLLGFFTRSQAEPWITAEIPETMLY